MFVALVIGILVGVAISGSGFVEASERDLLNSQIRDLRNQLDQSRARQTELADAQRSAEAFVSESYPTVMLDRMRDKRVGVVFVGPVDDSLRGAVDRAISDAGGERVRMTALEVPIDGRLPKIESELASRPALTGYAGEENLANLGRDLGREFVAGGPTPLWDALTNELVQERNGGAQPEVDGVVVVRTAAPQAGATARFLRGFYGGIGGQVPAVGVEATNEVRSAIDVYRRARLSSVDDIDTAVGRVALALLLAGARPGHYGVKATADAVLPPVESAPPPTTTGG